MSEKRIRGIIIDPRELARELQQDLLAMNAQGIEGVPIDAEQLGGGGTITQLSERRRSHDAIAARVGQEIVRSVTDSQPDAQLLQFRRR